MKKFIVLFSIFLLIFIFSGCSNKNSQPISDTKFALDTYCTLTVYDKVPKKVLDDGFKAIEDIEKKMSVTIEDSEVSEINKNAGIRPVKVSPDTFYVIKKAIHFSEIEKGYFDITVGPIVNLWNIGTDKARVPSAEEIKAKLPLVNYKNIVLDEKNMTVMLKDKGMSIDLGGIAKGYAADKVAEVLKKEGVKHAIINLGGDVLTIGTKPDGTNWRVGIQTPFKPRGEYFGIVEVGEKAVVTSGIYERYFEKDGKLYHHILNPFTGYPADNHLYSVTIITDTSIDGDALAKIFVMGLDEGLKVAENLPGVEAIFVTDDKKVYITSGLKGNFRITDPEYTLMTK
ncbi:thiamine biosynthesis lipoprotein [Caldanaerobacter subterraneus subsp. tengcongensis MB4]|uniref:FAD:protein FMN transferase n=3 Tax=Caldanaerobacter subterraneus TaxID=911092 RepID=Q8R7D3_CALS4|nr:FAD:protein FMN transferase [Caldanaerobacter subterraneus]AAM25612.1 Membrane-associated lipoprotein involved in thiamine biosynthesis [Caldanaerobacter subterraneus subsp. tengcongensis MB4]KKC28913.1 thiamine biosynthesis lipoprotein [Caldanaerobacter subterraneus subsp. pacificus DSM 12653]MCS3917516.1 thiamine biosynthesis lipoprotein [Caldanaerobacter subterraneus subsp. tengcongensis MB4]HBT48857.1 FAD:protein FMN transferase [Caldanaerobacter subterraneus]